MDDDAPKPIPQFEIGQKLDDLSVDEINETIELLHGEIARLEQARNMKSAHLDAAAALFAKK